MGNSPSLDKESNSIKEKELIKKNQSLNQTPLPPQPQIVSLIMNSNQPTIAQIIDSEIIGIQHIHKDEVKIVKVLKEKSILLVCQKYIRLLRVKTNTSINNLNFRITTTGLYETAYQLNSYLMGSICVGNKVYQVLHLKNKILRKLDDQIGAFRLINFDSSEGILYYHNLKLLIWSIETGQIRQTAIQGKYYQYISYCRIHKEITCLELDYIYRISISDGNILAQVPILRHSNDFHQRITKMQHSPNGQQLLVIIDIDYKFNEYTRFPSQLRVYDSNNLKELWQTRQIINQCQYSNNSQLVAASVGYTIRFYQAETGQNILIIQTPLNPQFDFFSREGYSELLWQMSQSNKSCSQILIIYSRRSSIRDY